MLWRTLVAVACVLFLFVTLAEAASTGRSKNAKASRDRQLNTQSEYHLTSSKVQARPYTSPDEFLSLITEFASVQQLVPIWRSQDASSAVFAGDNRPHEEFAISYFREDTPYFVVMGCRKSFPESKVLAIVLQLAKHQEQGVVVVSYTDRKVKKCSSTELK